MSAWDRYESRIRARGSTKRESELIRLHRTLSDKLQDSLSYKTVTINGIERSVVIDDSDNFNEKVMHSLPGETFRCGDVVDWADNHWLITEKDANTEIRTKVKLFQCNYLLKWVDSDNIIHEQWCVIEDGTKLKRIFKHMRNSLAYWKRYVKSTPLIAGNSLRHMGYNMVMKYERV